MQDHPVRVQLYNTTTWAYVNHQKGTKSRAALNRYKSATLLGRKYIPALSTIHNPRVNNWQEDFLSHQHLDLEEWSLLSKSLFKVQKPDLDILAFRFNNKLSRFIARSRDPLAPTVGDLVIPFTQFKLVYVFLPMKKLPWMLHMLEEGRVLLILMTKNWSRYSNRNTNIFRLLKHKPWPLPNKPNLLAQGPPFHPASQSLAIMA